MLETAERLGTFAGTLDCAVRDWCAVENGEFGVALMMRDSTLTEFGEIHPDKTCYTGKPLVGKTAIYPYLFTDWLQMHQPDGDSMNFTFRFSITSYSGDWKRADVERVCEDWLNPYAAWMRENNVPRVERETVAEPPPGWTGLIEKPRAGHGEKDCRYAGRGSGNVKDCQSTGLRGI